MKPFKMTVFLMLAAVFAGTAQPQDIIATGSTDWRGFFMGGNIGGAWNHTCDSWEPGATIRNTPALANRFYNRNCPNNGNFIGGVDLGYNFQYDQWVWGFKVDYDAVGSSSRSRAYTYVPTSPTDPLPAGTYTASGKISPDGIILLGPRLGYSIDQWLPWIRIGAAFALGSHNGSISYTPAAGGVNGVVGVPFTVNGSKDFSSSGFNFGLGVDYGINGPWSIVAEYNYVKLSKGDNSNVSCAASKGAVPPAICNAYSNFSLDNIHNSFTMNMFRVGFHYKF